MKVYVIVNRKSGRPHKTSKGEMFVFSLKDKYLAEITLATCFSKTYKIRLMKLI